MFKYTVRLAALLAAASMATAAQLPVNLGTAGTFLVLAKTAISTVGTTSIAGDIGISPAAASLITGFGLILDGPSAGQFATSSLISGSAYAADYAPPTPINMGVSILDMEAAYTDAAGRTLPDTTELGAGEIGGLTIAPGLHKWGTDVNISTNVTLSGSASAVWIFQISGDLTIASATQVVLIGGARAENIFWQVGGPTGVTLGTTSTMHGILLSAKQVIMTTGATLDGRALAQTQVTLDSNPVSISNAPPAPAAFDVATDVTQDHSSVGQYVTVAVTVTNTGGVSATGVTPTLQVNTGSGFMVAISGPLPSGPMTLMGGSSTTFLWTYSISGAGALNFTGTANGTDSSALTSVSGNDSDSATTVTASFLKAAVSTTPKPVSAGQWVTVVMTVTNSGGVAANGVVPALQINAGNALLTAINGPVPTGPLVMSAGGSTTFVWTYSVSGAGSVSFTLTAAGTDSGTLHPSAVSTSTVFTTLPTPSKLVSALSVGPVPAPVGQIVTVKLTVTNTGGRAANGVVPALQINASNGVLTPVSGPTPAGPLVIAAGGSTTFVWTYSVASAGSVSFTATATGADSANSSTVTVASSLVVFANPAVQRIAVNLGTAANFSILAKTGVSTTGTTAITGNIGVSPAAATYITGFGLILDTSNEFATSSLVVGKVYAADYAPPTPAKMTTAIQDMQDAYTDAAGRTLPDYTELGAGNIGGMTLTPGLYKWSSGVTIPANVTLTGSATDVWIFQIAQDLDIASGKQVILTGGALAKNVFWQVAGQATLATTATIKGVILSQTAIVLNNGATLNGRALAQSAVTLIANTVVASSTILVPALDSSMATTATPGQPVRITFTVTNNGWAPATNVTARAWDANGNVLAGPTASSTAWQSLGIGQSVTFAWSDTPAGAGPFLYSATASEDSQQITSGVVQGSGTLLPLVPTVDTSKISFVYPSPARDSANISYLMAEPGKIKIRIYNGAGQLVATIDEQKGAGSQATPITTSGFAPGVYIYLVDREYVSGRKDRISAKKFMVVR